MKCVVQEAAFDQAAEMAALTAARTDIGAVVSFTGLVRDMAQGAPVSSMTLEHYPAMTLREMERIATEAEARWPLQGGTVIHRYGRLEPGDAIVLVLVASAHREAAFEAAWFIMDWLKTHAPFWKKEESGAESHWVDARQSDDAALKRWHDNKEDNA